MASHSSPLASPIALLTFAVTVATLSQQTSAAEHPLSFSGDLRGGYYTLHRNNRDSSNVGISWTDGGHLTYQASNGWKAHLIAQHNAKEGPTNTMRSPLDFTDDDSRWTVFGAWENKQP